MQISGMLSPYISLLSGTVFCKYSSPFSLLELRSLSPQLSEPITCFIPASRTENCLPTESLSNGTARLLYVPYLRDYCSVLVVA